jgi:hypothetical protein
LVHCGRHLLAQLGVVVLDLGQLGIGTDPPYWVTTYPPTRVAAARRVR